METAGSSNETSRAGGPTDDIPELGGVSGERGWRRGVAGGAFQGAGVVEGLSG